MKKIFNLIAVLAVALSFTACHPLDNSAYKELGDLPSPVIPPTVVTGTLTLATADYGLLPATNYARTSLYFRTLDDAKASIPTILAAKYPTYANRSSVTVTYSNVPPTVTPADSVFANIAYTLQPADYTLNGGTTTFTNFSASQIITWLGIKYPAAVANQLAVITFNYFEAGATTTGVTQSFLYLNGAWTKLYYITNAQFASIGKGGTNNNFATADNASIPAYLNAFLKADPSVMFNAKAGDVRYVSYKHFKNATTNPTVAAVTSQRVAVLTYDGSNWVTTPFPAAPLAFAKNNGVWVADNTVNYTLTRPNHVAIADYNTGATAAAIANLRSFGNFSLSGGTAWTDAQVTTGIALFLKANYTTAVAAQKFVISYLAYNGTATVSQTKTFTYNGTDFVITP